MNKLLVIILSSLLLVGCAIEPQIVYKDRIVKVPEIVMEQCTPPPIVIPLQYSPLDTLHAESKNQEIARAYVKTVELQDNKLEQYKEALDAITDESE